MVDAHDGETYTAKGSRLIWIDCEMTGLDIFHDELCEISVVPTDFDLNVLDEGIDFVIKPSDAAVANMNDFVRAMHTRSGLINEWENGLSVEEAERKVTEYVARFTPAGVKPLLAGNSIGSDKKFLDRYMPNLMEHLHYRVIDVSTFKELARRWYPAVYNNRPPKNGLLLCANRRRQRRRHRSQQEPSSACSSRSCRKPRKRQHRPPKAQ